MFSQSSLHCRAVHFRFAPIETLLGFYCVGLSWPTWCGFHSFFGLLSFNLLQSCKHRVCNCDTKTRSFLWVQVSCSSVSSAGEEKKHSSSSSQGCCFLCALMCGGISARDVQQTHTRSPTLSLHCPLLSTPLSAHKAGHVGNSAFVPKPKDSFINACLWFSTVTHHTSQQDPRLRCRCSWRSSSSASTS